LLYNVALDSDKVLRGTLTHGREEMLMPAAKKPPTPSRTRFNEPASLKRLNKSLDTAQEALAELRKDTSRDLSKGAQDLYKDLRTFVSSARRDTGKLTRALQRDFEQAQRGGRAGSRAARAGAARGRAATKKPTARRSTTSN
jgi:hypothetical protein